MQKRVVAEPPSDGPQNATLEARGDRGCLLMERDLMFKGRTTYKDFLAGGEGIATNVLANRLQRLEAEGVIGKGRDAAFRLQALQAVRQNRSEEHTSELQSPCNLVCRLLLEKKKT